MEHGDEQESTLLLRQIHEVQVANLEVQRKLLDTVVSQSTRTEESSRRIMERTTLLQDRTMDMLVLNRRILWHGLTLFAFVVVLFLWRFTR